jgi:hypothetical protein
MTSFKNYVNMYEFETVLPGNGKTITFKPITTGQIKRLLLYETSNDAESIEKSLDNVITECVITPDFDIDDLYLQDRFYLLLDLRKATKGNTYSFQSKCTKCDSQTAQNINLNTLTVTKLETSTKNPSNELVKKVDETTKKASLRTGANRPIKATSVESQTSVQSPIEVVNDNWNIVELNKNLKIRLSHITRRMQRTLREYLNDRDIQLTEQQKEVEESTLLYAVAIKSVITPEGEDDQLSLDDKIYLVDNIPQGEIESITKWFADHDFGVDFSFDVVCAHCNEKERKVIPLDNFFF